MRPHKLLVGTIEEAFAPRFVAALGRHGVQAELGRIASKGDPERPPPILDQAKAFKASTVLLLSPAGGTFDRSGNVHAKFDGSLFDLATEVEVWRARIDWWTGATFSSTEKQADVLVDELLAALRADGLLGSGPAGVSAAAPASAPADKAN